MDLWLSGQLPGSLGASAARLGRIPWRPPGRARHRAPGSAEPGMRGSVRGSPLRNRGADANRCCQQGYSQGRRIARWRLPLKTPGFRRRAKRADPRQRGYPQLWITCGYFLVVMWITSLVRGMLSPIRRNGSAAGGWWGMGRRTPLSTANPHLLITYCAVMRSSSGTGRRAREPPRARMPAARCGGYQHCG
jgi:hypothetical protein